MINLVPYNENYESLIVDYIVSFFGFHSAINGQANSPELTQAKENIEMWTSEKHELYIIESDNTPVGFIHIWYKGGNVAWIEDVFVDESHRGQGIGSEAINSAEDIVKQKSGYTAVCMDVVPRNKNALATYHKLGYDTLSLITVHKELGENRREETADILGHKFKI